MYILFNKLLRLIFFSAFSLSKLSCEIYSDKYSNYTRFSFCRWTYS